MMLLAAAATAVTARWEATLSTATATCCLCHMFSCHFYVRTKLEMPDNHATLDIRTREEARHLTVD